MGLFSRLGTLIRSNINELINKAEDPEKMLNQVLVDMKGQLVEAKKQVAVAIALLKSKENSTRFRPPDVCPGPETGFRLAAFAAAAFSVVVGLLVFVFFRVFHPVIRFRILYIAFTHCRAPFLNISLLGNLSQQMALKMVPALL